MVGVVVERGVMLPLLLLLFIPPPAATAAVVVAVAEAGYGRRLAVEPFFCFETAVLDKPVDCDDVVGEVVVREG